MIKKGIWILLLCCVPFIVSASSINYDITNFLIDATILENGDLNVQELIVLDGNFSGYVRNLQYQTSKLESYEEGNINFSNSAIYNAEGISNISLKTRNVTNEKISFETFQKDFEPLSKVVSEKQAKDGNYIYRKDDNILSYKMYQSANDEKIAFYLSYTIDKAVVIHNDIAELYWTFIGSNNTDDMNNIEIRITLPKTSEEWFYWFHGDITSESEKINDNTCISIMKSIDKKSVIDARIIFSKDAITNQERLRNSKEDAYEKIWKIEEELIEKTNKQREFYRQVERFTKCLTIIYYIALTALWIFIYQRFNREYKSEFHSKYYREFTGEYDVAVIEFLMNKKITSNAMSASVMNLVYKNNIKIEKQEKKKSCHYQFVLMNNENVSDTEQILLDFLFEKLGKEKRFTLNDLPKKGTSIKKCEEFSKSFSEWENCVRKDAEREKFFEINGIPTVLGILVLLITILFFMVVVYYHVNFVPCYFLLPTGIMFLFYTTLIRKRSKKGNEDYLRWKALKRFLIDWEQWKARDLPSEDLWEKYLVYATVLGIPETLEKSMKEKLKSEEKDKQEKLSFCLENSIYSSLNFAIKNSINICQKSRNK